VPKDKTLYAVTMDAYAKCGQINECLRLWDELIESKIDFDLRVCGSLLNILAQEGRQKEMIDVLRQMHILCMPIDHGIIVSLLLACEKTKEWRTAIALCKFLEAQGMKFSIGCWSGLLRVARACGEYERPVYIFNRMKQETLIDGSFYVAFIEHLNACFMYDRARDVYNQMKEDKVKCSYKEYLVIMEIFDRLKNEDIVDEIFKKCFDHGFLNPWKGESMDLVEWEEVEIKAAIRHALRASQIQSESNRPFKDLAIRCEAEDVSGLYSRSVRKYLEQISLPYHRRSWGLIIKAEDLQRHSSFFGNPIEIG